jgi:uncharacterized membrane protein YraQ (UPF0718 family)
MQILIITSAVCFLLSLAADKNKTLDGTMRGIKMFINMLPSLLTVLALVSIFLYLVPDDTILKYLGRHNGALGIAVSAVIGSVSMIPSFVALPLAGILLQKGIDYTVLTVFITTLLMVGVFTIPIEIKYFGTKAAATRNILSFIGAVLIGVLIGIFM